MSEWRGLANPERHAPTSVTDMAWCNVCDGPCYSPEACCCCLAAEVKRLERAEAAIARVREVCSQSRAVVRVGCRCSTDECSGKCGAGKPLAWNLDPADVLRALEVECPTCRGPIRETVGLVCQTCGTDYGRLDGTA